MNRRVQAYSAVQPTNYNLEQGIAAQVTACFRGSVNEIFVPLRC